MEAKGTIFLEDATGSESKNGFSLMLKPVGALCNLGCSYCYYQVSQGATPKMTPNLLECAIRSYSDACNEEELHFIWHGGEPLLAGLGFFRKAVELERRYCKGRKIFNSIQTNGTLLNPEWADFFRDNNFLVGLSIDGPIDIHNSFRKDRGGFDSFDKVLNALKMLRDRVVNFNTLTTVNRASEGRGAEVYTFLKGQGSRFMQFLPVMEFGPASSASISANGFGRFMSDIFDIWVKEDVGRVYVQLFDATLAAWCGLPSGLCTLGRRCGGTAVIEHNGDVYLCDHCVDTAIGNIQQTSLKEIMSKPEVESFAAEKAATLPRRCLDCQWLPACYGECPVHRKDGINALCEGYRLFFSHAAEKFDRMRTLLLSGHAPAEIMNNFCNFAP